MGTLCLPSAFTWFSNTRNNGTKINYKFNFEGFIPKLIVMLYLKFSSHVKEIIDRKKCFKFRLSGLRDKEQLSKFVT